MPAFICGEHLLATPDSVHLSRFDTGLPSIALVDSLHPCCATSVHVILSCA
ncbi:MAG TPA: hypothetical protein VJ654_10070 [Noviherbaspirillum sp.]|nr:hypothetical protein [Noviherbaspirillum sp.]